MRVRTFEAAEIRALLHTNAGEEETHRMRRGRLGKGEIRAGEETGGTAHNRE
jgi:hypothetical protein